MLKVVVGVAVAIASTVAVAEVDGFRLRLSDVLHANDVDGIVTQMSDPFENHGLWFSADACVRFNKPGRLAGAERKQLVECLTTAGGVDLMADRAPGAVWVKEQKREGAYVVFELAVRDRKLRSIGSAASNAKERALPTLSGRGQKLTLALSPKTRAAVAKLPERVVGTTQLPNGVVENLHKICFDAKGRVTSRRLVERSDLPAFDRETTKALAAVTSVEAYVVDGTPRSACELVRVDHSES